MLILQFQSCVSSKFLLILGQYDEFFWTEIVPTTETENTFEEILENNLFYVWFEENLFFYWHMQSKYAGVCIFSD